MVQNTVLIADDHPVYRRGLKELLETAFRVIGEAREGGEAVDKAVAQRPDVVVMDITMPGMDGIEAARQIKEQLPKTGVVIVSATDEEPLIFDAIQAGANGYVLKSDEPTNMLQAVQNAADGRAYLPPLIAKRVLHGIAKSLNGGDELGQSSNKLSSRELAVLKLIAQGERNRDIANKLCISERTVGNHITSIYTKLGIYDRAQAIVYAIKKGIVRI